MVSLLVVDNYDSFVYTIVDYLRQLGATTTVVRNDAASLDMLDEVDGVLISPGPGNPAGAGISMEMIRACAERQQPMLGVCLGHQALAEVYGAEVSHAPELMHGKTSVITHTETGIFEGLPSPLEVTRYHSLAVTPHTMPAELRVTGSVPTPNDSHDVIMAIEHRSAPLWGVQFHPEAVLTQGGHRMLANWLALVGDKEAPQRARGMAPLMNR